jgi:hypothetical protein
MWTSKGPFSHRSHGQIPHRRRQGHYAQTAAILGCQVSHVPELDSGGLLTSAVR